MEGKMQFSIQPQGIWYHGLNEVFEVLEEGSTITQFSCPLKAFARALLDYRNDFIFNYFHG